MNLPREVIKAMHQEGNLYARAIEAAQPKMELPHLLTIKWHCHYCGFSPDLRCIYIDIEYQSPYFAEGWLYLVQSELARVLERDCLIMGSTYRPKKIAGITYRKVPCFRVWIFRLGEKPIKITSDGIEA